MEEEQKGTADQTHGGITHLTNRKAGENNTGGKLATKAEKENQHSGLTSGGGVGRGCPLTNKGTIESISASLRKKKKRAAVTGRVVVCTPLDPSISITGKGGGGEFRP